MVGHEIGKQDLRVGAWQAVYRETLEAQSLEDAVAALGTVATVVQFLPVWAAIGDFASQTDRAVGVGATNSGRVAVLVLWVEIVAVG